LGAADLMEKSRGAVVFGIAAAILMAGCSSHQSTRWPEETKPDLQKVKADIVAQAAELPHVASVSGAVSGDGLNMNEINIYVESDSTYPDTMRTIANEVERRAAFLVAPLLDSGSLFVVVSARSQSGGVIRMHPDNMCGSWDSCAQKYDLERPKPPRRR